MINPTENKLLREHYNPEGSLLRQQQLRMLDMLKYIDAICQKHNIKYWLCSGTLLGAVRHGGFIPWDDDLDIEMPRADYEKLIKILSSNNNSKYILQNHKNDKKYYLPFAKLRDTKSELIEGSNKGLDYKYKGIFIDLFPLDPNFYFLMKISERLLAIVLKISRAKRNWWGLKSIVANILFSLGNNILFPTFRCISRTMSSNKSLYHTYGLPFFKKRDLTDIFPLTNITFEGQSFPCPKDTDAYLRKIYGNNYQDLPPIERRRGEHLYKLKFYD